MEVANSTRNISEMLKNTKSTQNCWFSYKKDILICKRESPRYIDCIILKARRACGDT